MWEPMNQAYVSQAGSGQAHGQVHVTNAGIGGRVSASLQVADARRCWWSGVFLPACALISGRVEPECEGVKATVGLQELPGASFTANYITAN